MSALRVIACAAMMPLVAAIAPAAAPPAVGTLPPEAYLLPGDSGAVLGFDVRGFFASRMWTSPESMPFFGSLPPDRAAEVVKEFRTGLEKGLAEMEQDVGVRADRELDRVIVSARFDAASEPSIVGIAFGRFEPAKVVAATEAAARKKGATLQRKQVAGGTMHWRQTAGRNETFAFAFLGNETVTFGEVPLVEAVLAARAERRRPLDGSADIASRLLRLKPGTGMFVLFGEAMLAKLKQESKSPPPFPMPRTLGVTVEFDGVTDIEAEMPTEVDAKNLAEVVQGGLAMLRMQAAQNPEVKQVGDFGAALAGIKVETQGKGVRLTAGPEGGGGMGVFAAIAIPSLLRARVSANEAAAIGDLRTVTSAQAAFQAANKGSYGDLPCLSQPSTCLKGYAGPQFLDEELTSLRTKSGYLRAFHPGPPARARPRSLQAWAYTAWPAEPAKTGVRSFCTDANGVIRFDPKGGEIKPVGGVCPAALARLD
jgi:hypothetical protein